MLLGCVFNIIQFNIFYTFPCSFPFYMAYLEVCVLIPKHLIFLLSTCNYIYLQFISTVNKEYILHNFSPFMFIETCFMFQHMLYFLRFAYIFEKNNFSIIFKCNALSMSIKPNCLIMFFGSSIFLLIFSLFFQILEGENKAALLKSVEAISDK